MKTRIAPTGSAALACAATLLLHADLRGRRDGNLYQLATSPLTGVTINRYSLARSS